MKCEELDSLFRQIPACSDVEGGIRVTTHCLYPSSDNVEIFIGERNGGYRITDGGGAWRNAQRLGRASDNIFERACKRHSVEVAGGIIVAHAPHQEWVHAAAIAVANASAMAARTALEMSARAEKSLNASILDALSRNVPSHKIARNYEYRGRSGHLWPIDFAVFDNEVMLLKSVTPNGNSINSSYATFGDIGDQPDLTKIAVFENELRPDNAALLRQVASLVPLKALEITVSQGLH